ncbi:LRR receptor-like serine/threonine-protein kinase FLS2 [Capsicum annuum]|uniref:LRR receptor-like serine/threonine-protein kinase FLS2 n=1 Tax=Capsicum annuum TaxID=4072 RepID=UPI001FB14EA8|nr:LRR receptor-like serine/threonine-protein kinase FLS2 [Capsicum annuum]
MVCLEFLDLSDNNISGTIPMSLEKLQYLKYFNVSANKLHGEIPSGGPFKNLSSQFFICNEELCGSSRFGVPPCPTSSKHKSNRKKLLVLFLFLGLAILFVPIIFVFLSIRYRRGKRAPQQADSLSTVTRERILYYELLQATDDLSESNRVRFGSFGSVYKGIIRCGTAIEVKVFNLQLDVTLRVLIRNVKFSVAFAIGISCSLPVIHCDVKPSNVLLDEDMVSHLSDFGISKLLGEDQGDLYTKTFATFRYALITSKKINYTLTAGIIPQEIGNLVNLMELWMESNQMAGSVPISIFNISVLKVLSLAGNNLNGFLSHKIGILTKMQFLYHTQNRFTGEIPKEIINLVELEELLLGSNRFRGPLTMVIFNISGLRLGLIDSHNNWQLEKPSALQLE